MAPNLLEQKEFFRSVGKAHKPLGPNDLARIEPAEKGLKGLPLHRHRKSPRHAAIAGVQMRGGQRLLIVHRTTRRIDANLGGGPAKEITDVWQAEGEADALGAGILNTWSRFAIPAFTPTLLNVAFIAMSLWAAPYFDPPALVLAWAVFVGGILQLSLQIYALHRLGKLPRITLDFRTAWANPGVRRILWLMAPAVLGVSVSQISLLINTIFASFLAHGSVSWLYYADRLMEFPAGMLGAALGTILLPSLTKHHANNDPAEYSKLLDWGLRLTLLLAAPAAVGLALLAVPLIASLFYHGAFTINDVHQTAHALIAYSIGLTGMILVKVLAPGYYAKQNVRTPVKIALVSLTATQLMNLCFIQPFAHAGLALSIGLAACLNAVLLYRGLRHLAIYQPQAGWGKFSLKLLAGLLVMATVLWFGRGENHEWLALSTGLRLLWLGWLVPSAALVYFITLGLLGFRLGDFKRLA